MSVNIQTLKRDLRRQDLAGRMPTGTRVRLISTGRTGVIAPTVGDEWHTKGYVRVIWSDARVSASGQSTSNGRWHENPVETTEAEGAEPTRQDIDRWRAQFKQQSADRQALGSIVDPESLAPTS